MGKGKKAMGKGDKKNPKGTKTVSVKDLPPKPKGGDSVKGGVVKMNDLIIT